MENTNEFYVPKNRRSLQKRAADLMMEGDPAPVIAKKLGVRLTTVVRWQQKSAAFRERIALHKKSAREELALGMIRVVRESGRYAAAHPNGKLENTLPMLTELAKLSQLID